MTPSSRLEGIHLSLIRRMNLGALPGTISLGLGEPGWPMPNCANRALERLGGDCSYGPNSGLPELQQALAARALVDVDRILISAGSQAALFAIFQAWLSVGDAVLVPDPGFLAYPVLAKLAGAQALPYQMDTTGQPDLSMIEALLQQPVKARMLIINHPANPTGRGIDQSSLAELAAFCRTHDLLLVSDEVYAELWFDKATAGLRSVSSDGIVLSSFSKAWAAPGLRLGWAEASAEILAPARLIHNYMTTAAARPSQLAALALLDNSDQILPAARLEVSSRWECLRYCLEKELEITACPPAGGFYYWLKLPPSALSDPVGFCLQLRDQAGVIVIPGLAFGEAGRGYVRLSFAGTTDDICQGVRRLAPYWRNT